MTTDKPASGPATPASGPPAATNPPGGAKTPAKSETPTPGVPPPPTKNDTPTPGLPPPPAKSDTPTPGVLPPPAKSDTPTPGVPSPPAKSDTPTPGVLSPPAKNGTPTPADTPSPPKNWMAEASPIRGAGQTPAGPRGSQGPTAFSGTIEGAGGAPSGPSGRSTFARPASATGSVGAATAAGTGTAGTIAGGPAGISAAGPAASGTAGPAASGAAGSSTAGSGAAGSSAAGAAGVGSAGGGVAAATVGRFLSEVERARAGLTDDRPGTATATKEKPSSGDPAASTGSGSTATEVATPGKQKPGETKPGETKPGDAKPGDAKPGDAKPGEAKPREDTPGEAGDGAAEDAAEKAGGKRKRLRKPLPSDRPPGAPPDPWTAFATTAERAPGRIRRGLRRLGQALRHEYALVIYGGIALAALLTWPTLRYPLHTVPQELYDPARQAWQIAWSGHILKTNPAQLWQSNAFFPERDSFAFGDSLLGYAPFGMLGEGPDIAVLRYNILFVLAHALLAIGGYALVRQLGAGRTGATVAAVAFAYAPWRLAQDAHLDVISAGGIPLALAMLARGHGWSMRHGFRRQRRHAGWATAGWLVAAWQISLGFSLGVPFAYVLIGILIFLVIAVPIRWWRRASQRPVLGWRLWAADALGALIVAFIGLLIAIPYLRTPRGGPSSAEIDFFSPPLRSLVIGPADSRVWGSAHDGARALLGWPSEMSLLPGFMLYALALAGLFFSVWKLWHRLVLLAAVAVAVILTLGTGFFDGKWTYLPLFGHFPASFGLRIPGRMMLWVTLLLAILAAGTVAEVVRRAEHWAAERIPPFPGPWLRLATFVPLILVLVEVLNTTSHPVVPAQPTAMRTVTSPTLVLPTAALGDQTVMLWSTSRFQPIANGSGGFAAAQQAEFRQAVAAFPDATSIAYLRETGIETVILLRNRTAGTAWERAGDIPVDALGIQREDLDNNTVLFRLKAQDAAGGVDPANPPGTTPTLPIPSFPTPSFPTPTFPTAPTGTGTPGIS